jgi:hypothetical protein
MGRGRQKAKATRVARDLKYSGPEMDLDRLAKELHGQAPEANGQSTIAVGGALGDEDPYEDDNYAQHA